MCDAEDRDKMVMPKCFGAHVQAVPKASKLHLRLSLQLFIELRDPCQVDHHKDP